MYSNKLALAVKHKGKVLRENGEEVVLPFGSEYTLLLRNLNNVRAAISVFIDGFDVANGSKILLNPNSSFELERFIGSSLEAGNRFMFISNAHRRVSVGSTASTGLIRVEAQYEKQPAARSIVDQRLINKPTGSTVNGAITQQKFFNASPPELELQVTVLVLKLVGAVNVLGTSYAVTQPTHVRTRTSCTACGTACKNTAKFCSECGASIQYVNNIR